MNKKILLLLLILIIVIISILLFVNKYFNNKKEDIKIFAYPYGAYTNETVRTLKNNGIDMQLYDIGINDFNSFNNNYIKRINIPCEMTGIEIIEEIERDYSLSIDTLDNDEISLF